MVGLTKYFASKFGKNNITVNMISPGGVLSNQSKKVLNLNIQKNFFKSNGK